MADTSAATVTLSRRVRPAAAPLRPPAPGLATSPPASQSLIAALRSAGVPLVTNADATYERARHVFDTRFDYHPQAIALCRAAGDVQACLAAAQHARVAFRVRGGGHSFAGYSGCDGLIVDVTGLNTLAIDPAAMTATVGGGCKQGDLNTALLQAGLHLPTGDWEEVCVGGYMQGGGFGATSRTNGLNSDHVIAVRVMLADGRVVHADEHTNYDLYWAVRGGTGNNFGVLLDITYRLRPRPQLSAGIVAFSLAGDAQREQGIAALMAYQAGFMLTAPATLNSSALIAETVDPASESPWLVIETIQVGSEAERRAAIQPLLSLPGATEAFDWTRVLSPDPLPPFNRTSRLIERLVTAQEWRALLRFMDQSPNRWTQLFLKAHGGALNQYPREASAFVHRQAHFNLFMDTFWPTPQDQAAADAFRKAWQVQVAPLWAGHIYQNFPETDAPDYRRNYWGDAYPALAAVKAKYDPTGAFDFPQAILAADAGPVRWPEPVARALACPIQTQ